MRAVVMHETGGPEVLRLEEVPNPEPADGEVLVQGAAASVTPVDWKQRSGVSDAEVPIVLGRDVSGTVVASSANGFSEGDEVFGSAPSGGGAGLGPRAAGRPPPPA